MDSNFTIRKLEPKDANLMLEWMIDKTITCNFRFNFLSMTKEKVLDFINHSCDDKNKHFAIINSKDEYQGTVSLKNISYIDRNAEYAIVTRKCAQGTGAAYQGTIKILEYAFNELALHRVYLNVLEDNIRANEFYKKCGFSFEGKFLNHIYVDNELKNLNWYGINLSNLKKIIAK